MEKDKRRYFIDLDFQELEESRDKNGFKKSSLFYTPPVENNTTETKNSIFYNKATESRNKIFNEYHCVNSCSAPIIKDIQLINNYKNTIDNKKVDIDKIISTKPTDFKYEQISGEDQIKLNYIHTNQNLIGYGLHSSVFLGTYSVSNITNKCAIKKYNCDLESQQTALNEISIMNLVSNKSPDIIQFFGFKIENPGDNHHYLLLFDFALYGSMWDCIKTKTIGKLGWLKWAKQLTSALIFLKDLFIIHHDIKPQNILIMENYDLKLGDFGSAVNIKMNDGDILQLKDALGLGTQSYSAPETLNANTSYSFPIDIYSTGVTLFIIISVTEPFKFATSPVHLILGIKRGFFESGLQSIDPIDVVRFNNGEIVDISFINIIQRMVSLNPDERPTPIQVFELLNKAS